MLDVDDLSSMSTVTVRRDLRPGDIGEIVRLHGNAYGAEYELGPRFEAGVASSLADSIAGGWPQRGGLWIVERAGRHAGSVIWTDEEDGARVRLVLLDRAVRGQGLARRLMRELLAECAGRDLVYLYTFSELTEAASMYRSLGFSVTDSRPYDDWDRPIVLQRYELRR